MTRIIIVSSSLLWTSIYTLQSLEHPQLSVITELSSFKSPASQTRPSLSQHDLETYVWLQGQVRSRRGCWSKPRPVNQFQKLEEACLASKLPITATGSSPSTCAICQLEMTHLQPGFPAAPGQVRLEGPLQLDPHVGASGPAKTKGLRIVSGGYTPPGADGSAVRGGPKISTGHGSCLQ
jgi:hypothetical protein